ncbi:ABC transporter permease subunit, partial [Escherichia coli]|uniref:ABC transporter permease subunit n=1 Tax=Escherichia coli TaxID=562 RepID=UPI001FCEA9AB
VMCCAIPPAPHMVLWLKPSLFSAPPMPSEMMNLVKTPATASTIGLVDMAAQAGKLLDYSAHAWESFTAITLAYVLINAFIMLVMTLVERKVRLPGNMGGK